MATQTEPRTIQDYAASLNVEYIGDVDPRCGGMFIAPRGEHDDHVNVLEIIDAGDDLILSCKVALIRDSWYQDALRAMEHVPIAGIGGEYTDTELAYAVVTYGYPVDPMQPGHYFDDFEYERVIPYDDVPDEDTELMDLLIPYIDRLI